MLSVLTPPHAHAWQEDTRNPLEAMDIFITLCVVLGHGYMYISRFIKMYILNICNFFIY